MKIIGAGLAGLLAGNMMRKFNPVVVERSDGLPNNHTALLRHREDKISEATSIPFRKVKVQKAISIKDNYGNSILLKQPNSRLSNQYSFKVTGSYLNRSIDNLDDCYRWIAPPDFINQLSLGLDIKYSVDVDTAFIEKNNDNPIISTMPMPEIAKLLNVDVGVEFKFRPIHVISCDISGIECDLYQTIYYPELDNPLYRVSITGNRLILEFTTQIFPENVNKLILLNCISNILLNDFGFCDDAFSKGQIYLENYKLKNNKYGKIKDISPSARKDFIKFLTDEYNIYSLGRYATWRNILLDDVHNDVLVIQKLISSNGYFTG